MAQGRRPSAVAVACVLFVADCAVHQDASAPAALEPVRMVEPMPAPPSAAGPPRPDPSLLEVAWAKALPALAVECANTGAKAEVRLYEDDGSLNPAEVDSFSEVAADSNGVHPLNPRVVRLAVKAAHHFEATRLVVVSAYRKPRTRQAADHHSRGEALDFRLPGVDYRRLAAYLRSLPRVGVGVYTDPRTHYVHLDVRDKSFHWLDASPPGVTWREAQLPDPKQATRDAAWSDDSDLPLEEQRPTR